MMFVRTGASTSHSHAFRSFPICRYHSFRADLARVIDNVYPIRTVPDRIDDYSLRAHALAGPFLERAVVQPSVRYRGFRVELPAATTTTAVTSSKAAVTVATGGESSAAWRLQQRLEFIPFEERVRRMSIDEEDSRHRVSGTAAMAEAAGIVAEAANASAGGNVHGGEVGAASSAKRFPMVLADYLTDASTIGMGVVDQPGTGLTTALICFMEWYCRGEVAGGRVVSEVSTKTFTHKSPGVKVNTPQKGVPLTRVCAKQDSGVDAIDNLKEATIGASRP